MNWTEQSYSKNCEFVTFNSHAKNAVQLKIKAVKSFNLEIAENNGWQSFHLFVIIQLCLCHHAESVEAPYGFFILLGNYKQYISTASEPGLQPGTTNCQSSPSTIMLAGQTFHGSLNLTILDNTYQLQISSMVTPTDRRLHFG